ncbi:MAG: DUF2282 domain-containing protein [Usitatibacter sp.]
MQGQATIRAAIAALFAAALPASAHEPQRAEQPPGTEQCYGVAKAGENNCGTQKHACAGMGTRDNDPAEWKYVPQGTCRNLGGKTSPPAAKKK